MSDFFYLQRTPRPRQHGRHRGGRRPIDRDKRRAGRMLSAVPSPPWQLTGRHLPGLIASAALLVTGVGLIVWAVLW